MHSALLHFFDYFNTIILLYFVATNGVYMVLMGICLYSVSQYSRYSKRSTNVSDVVESPVTPPVALIVPAYNEEKGIVATVSSLLALNYPEKEIIVIDDGSSDHTVQNLIDQFGLLKMDLIYRPQLPSKEPYAFYFNPQYPELTVVSKVNGGKSDALNCGINIARSPYFCTVDADTIIERDALVRLMAPVLNSTMLKRSSGLRCCKT